MTTVEHQSVLKFITAGNGATSVLLIPPIAERSLDNFVSSISSDLLAEYTLIYPFPIPRNSEGAIDHQCLLSRCRKIIKLHSITILYANKSIGSFIRSVLVKEFSDTLHGASVDSVFSCNHLFYTITKIDSQTDEKLPFLSRNVYADVFDLANFVLNNFHTHGVIRSALGAGHSIYCFKNRDQLIKVLKRCRQDAANVVQSHVELVVDNVDCAEFAKALEPLVVIQPYFDFRTACSGHSWRMVMVEAYVCDGTVTPWAMASSVSRDDCEFMFSGCEFPASLSGAERELLDARFARDADNLVGLGFDYGFMHVNYFLFENGFLHLVSVHPHCNPSMAYVYRLAFADVDLVVANFRVAAGDPPRPPPPPSQRSPRNYVLQHVLITPVRARATSLVNFAQARDVPSENLVLCYDVGMEVVVEPSKDYAVLGHVTVAGADYAECLSKVKDIRSRVLQIPELVPLMLYN